MLRSRRPVLLSESARSLGVHIQAGRGSGKSRLAGWILAPQDFARGIPLVIIDPVGGTIDNFLHQLTRLPRDAQAQVWQRVMYVDMAGQGESVVPWPFYYRVGKESSAVVAQRLLEVIRASDPQLIKAPLLGWNPLFSIGMQVGMILAALDGYQITEAEDLLDQPEQWEARFAEAASRHPDVAPAVDFFRTQYQAMNARQRELTTTSFRAKIRTFQLDPRLRAMFGAGTPYVSWSEVVANRQAVLLDFRRVESQEERRFKLLWLFYSLLTFIKQRGIGRHTPLSIILDELVSMTVTTEGGENPFAAAFEELCNVYMRNARVWLTCIHQELYQLPQQVQNTLLSFGTQIIGRVSDINDALVLAKQLTRIDPYKIKRTETVYGSVMGAPREIDSRPVEFTIPEQQYEAAYTFTNLRLFEFFVRPAHAEGDVGSRLYRMNIKNVDPGQWVNEQVVARARNVLRDRTGLRQADVLAAIDARRQFPPAILAALPHESHISPQIIGDDDDEFGEPIDE